MRVVAMAACVMTLLSALPAAASETPADAAQGRRMLDDQPARAGLTQRLTLSDGSQLYGRVESVETDMLQFRTIAGVEMTVPREQIADLRIVSGRIVSGEFLPTDSHNTRLLFSPTGRALKKGEGYFGVYELVLPFVQVGVTDRFSIGGGTPLIFGGGESDRPFWFTPKLQLLAGERMQIAAGVIQFVVNDYSGGIAYGVTTLGSAEKAATLGFGYAYSGGHRAPILMVGGEYRASRRIKWITENWVWGGSSKGFVSGGVRFLGERLSADFGLIVPLVDDTVAFPMVSFAWRF